MEMTDDHLVRAVLGGDRGAFAHLYDRYAPLIRAISAEKTTNLSDAQDLTQEVFVRAFEKLGQLRKPERFGPWLVSFARHVGLEWCRNRNRERRRLAGTQIDVEEIASCGVDDHEAITELRIAIAQLPEKERLAIHLFYLDEQHVDKTRSLLRLSRSGFYRLLERARSRLESLMRKEQEIHR